MYRDDRRGCPVETLAGQGSQPLSDLARLRLQSFGDGGLTVADCERVPGNPGNVDAANDRHRGVYAGEVLLLGAAAQFVELLVDKVPLGRIVSARTFQPPRRFVTQVSWRPEEGELQEFRLPP